jgi:endonuclease G
MLFSWFTGLFFCEGKIKKITCTKNREMAKFRANHSRQKRGGSGSQVVKVGLFTAIIGGLFFVFNFFLGGSQDGSSSTQTVITDKELPQAPDKKEFTGEFFLPGKSSEGRQVKHTYFALSYLEEHEQPEWVAYELTREQVQSDWVERTDDFRPDPKVPSASASPRDYTGTGYHRGHLIPAADMAFSEKAISETFLMSNSSPQIRNFNTGIWRELEGNIRNWAKEFRHLYIVTGPALKLGIREKIGGNEVSVPDVFYKVILDYTEPGIKGIGFLIPNEVSVKPLSEYAVTIDEVERQTGIDFFPELLPDDEEQKIESRFEMADWPLAEDRYQRRLKIGNE